MRGNSRSTSNTFVVLTGLHVFCLAIIGSFCDASYARSIVLDSEDRIAGISCLDVGDAWYEVTFADGTCVDLFDGCDALEDFGNHSDEELRLTLRNIALLLISENVFPEDILGCGGAACSIHHPRNIVSPTLVGAWATNYPNSEGYSSLSSRGVNEDTSANDERTWITLQPSGGGCGTPEQYACSANRSTDPHPFSVAIDFRGVFDGGRATDVSNSGQIGGFGDVPNMPNIRVAFSCSLETGLEILGTTIGDTSETKWVLDDGAVVVQERTPSNWVRTSIWTPGSELTLLDPLSTGGDDYSLVAQEVSRSASRIAGRFGNLSFNRGFTWSTTSGLTELVPIGEPNADCAPQFINESGEVVGYCEFPGRRACSESAIPPFEKPCQSSFLWSPSLGMQVLPNASDGPGVKPFCSAESVNNVNQAAGLCGGFEELLPGQFFFLANGAIWNLTGNSVEEFEPQGALSTRGFFINDAGEIAGDTEIEGGYNGPFFRSANGEIFLVADVAGFESGQVRGLNNQGFMILDLNFGGGGLDMYGWSHSLGLFEIAAGTVWRATAANGHVIGFGSNGPVYWVPGQEAVFLPNHPWARSNGSPLAVNSSGMVVGYGHVSSSVQPLYWSITIDDLIFHHGFEAPNLP